MAPVATLLTPLTRTDIKENQERIERLPDETIQLQSASRVHSIAIILTYLTLIVEGLVALVFLLPIHSWVRDAVFIFFLISGYLTVTVPSFGMILACLGFAQSSNPKAQFFYKIICLLLPLTKLRFYLSEFYLSE
jgi:surface polysaccharide O-acyltransferase-like enzyme